MIDNKRNWNGVNDLSPFSYVCGYDGCGREVSSEKGWVHSDARGAHDGILYICPQCKRPSFFDGTEGRQFPGTALGAIVRGLPQEIDALWSEIRASASVSAYTSAVLAGRTLLMHIAVGQGAPANKGFVEYVNYLVDKHFAPPNSKQWVDKIRSHGNEAAHQVVIKSQADAEEIMVFLEMLLKFIYEFPSRGSTP
jgi:hypothetical protein